MALQYKIELAISGMVDGPPGGLPLGERLARLREHRAHMRAGTFAGTAVHARVTVISSRYLARIYPAEIR